MIIFDTVTVYMGPTLGEGMVYISLNLVAFLITLLLVLRIGPGKLGRPLFLIGLGFLTSALVPMLFSVKHLWLAPVLQTLFSMLGIMFLMNTLGVWDLVLKDDKENEK